MSKLLRTTENTGEQVSMIGLMPIEVRSTNVPQLFLDNGCLNEKIPFNQYVTSAKRLFQHTSLTSSFKSFAETFKNAESIVGKFALTCRKSDSVTGEALKFVVDIEDIADKNGELNTKYGYN